MVIVARRRRRRWKGWSSCGRLGWCLGRQRRALSVSLCGGRVVALRAIAARRGRALVDIRFAVDACPSLNTVTRVAIDVVDTRTAALARTRQFALINLLQTVETRPPSGARAFVAADLVSTHAAVPAR